MSSSYGSAALTAPPTAEQVEKERKRGRRTDKIRGALNPAQRDFVSLSNEVQLYLGGWGVGKTFIGAWKSLVHMLDNPGCEGLALAPIFAQTKNQYRAMMRLLGRIRALYGIDLVESSKISNGEGSITLTNGSVCWFRSAGSKTGLFGLTVAFVWIDEVELCEDPQEVFEDAYSRIRQQSDPGLSEIKRCSVYLTSTAHYMMGLLKDLLERAEKERREYREAVETGAAEPPIPTVGVVRAPSTRAIGYGLKRERIEAWLRNMDPETFLRAVMCELTAPPETVFADVVSAARYDEGGNVVDYAYEPENPSYIWADWGIKWPYFCFVQKVPRWDAYVVLDEWGPDGGSSVAETVREMRRVLKAYKLIDANGYPTARKRFAVIGDPTTNPGCSPAHPDEEHMLALDGRAAVNALRWPYGAPNHPIQRLNIRQVQFVRTLLRPRGTKPRLLFSRYLTVGKNEQNAHKQTRRGAWGCLTEGLKHEKTKKGRVLDGVHDDKFWKHAFDAIAFGCVVGFSKDFWRLYSLSTGLAVSAAAWK
jgi:hypothetical protein